LFRMTHTGMKVFRNIIEKIVEALLTVSGAITTITILLIVVFLFREGFGLFKSPAVEKGYALCVNSTNTVSHLGPYDIKQIFDYEIENWLQVGGKDEPIQVFRFEQIFNRYSDEELGADNDYEFLSEKLGEVIAETPGIVAFLPEQYLPENNSGVRILRGDKITPADFFGGREWIPTATPAPSSAYFP